MELLEKHGMLHDHVLNLDFANVFPVLTQSPAPGGYPVLVDVNGTFTYQNHVTPEVFFKGAEAVLVPKFTISPPTLKALVDIYGPYIMEHYAYVDQNDCWQLLKRK